MKNADLKDFTTMRLGGPAGELETAYTRDDIVRFATQAETEHLPLLILGEGSNVIVTDEGFPGLVVLNRLSGFEVLQNSGVSAQIKIGAGMVWDEAVAQTVLMGLSGIENLSSIPGYAGAAPIQNIGAYGQEIADSLLELEAYDTQQKQFVILKNADCDFTYRQSIFNSTAKRRYVIISITLELRHSVMEPPFYDSLQHYLDAHNITDYSPVNLRQAVKTIRADKLPDPSVIANTGSFFKNPLIDQAKADDLTRQYSNVPLFSMGDGMYKVSAGWLIEQAGLRGLHMDGMAVYDKNALVLVNESAASYQQLANIREHIIDTVRAMFQILLTQEPEEIEA